MSRLNKMHNNGIKSDSLPLALYAKRYEPSTGTNMFEQGKIYTDVMVNELHVARNGDAFDINFSFVSAGNTENVWLLGVRDPSNIHELLSAERLWVEAIKDGQLEFGRYTLGISHEGSIWGQTTNWPG